jgi:hypothetical protein
MCLKGFLMITLTRFKKLLVATALFGAAGASNASLIPLGAVSQLGTGLGAVNTVLTLDNNAQTGLASGSVIRSGGMDMTTGDAKTGNAQYSTYSFGQLGVTDAADLVFVFNADEPGNAGSVTVESLVLSIYSDMGGTALFTASLVAPEFLADTQNGIGKSGYAFGLDDLQAGMAQAFLSPSARIGLASSLSGATGGPDTFFVTTLDNGGPGNEVPEPGSAALLGLGMFGVWAIRRRGARA